LSGSHPLVRNMAAKKARKILDGRTEGEPIPVKFQLLPSESTSSFYCNYVEVAHSPYEFSLSFAKILTKLRPEQISTAKAGQPLVVDSMVQVEVPTNLVPGLIKALNIERKKYEKRFGKIRKTG